MNASNFGSPRHCARDRTERAANLQGVIAVPLYNAVHDHGLHEGWRSGVSSFIRSDLAVHAGLEHARFGAGSSGAT